MDGYICSCGRVFGSLREYNQHSVYRKVFHVLLHKPSQEIYNG